MDSLRNMSKELQSKQSGERGRRGVTATDLRFNDLIFENIANASLISQRHDEIFNSVSIDYRSGASSVDFVFQSGEQLVDPKNSCIEFDLVVSTTTAQAQNPATKFNFDTGSVMNIFSDVILHSKGGDEIDRLQNAGIYRANADLHEPKDWFDTVGELMGYGDDKGDIENKNYLMADTHFFQVPLNKVLNVFSNDLIPAQMISGARLQLILNRNKRYLFKLDQNDGNVTYELKNVRMVLSLLRPTDAVLRELKKMSINTGLVYTWPAVYTQKNKADTSLNEQVSKSVARATLVRVTPLKPQNDLTELNITPKIVNYKEAQVRCGSSYFPQYRLKDSQVYRNTLSAVGKLGHPVRYNKTDSKANGDVWCTSLETHGLISYSGVSLNNSRVLYIESKFEDPVTGAGLTANGECFIFVEYMKTSRCYETSLATDE